jgi:hypothetical protein
MTGPSDCQPFWWPFWSFRVRLLASAVGAVGYCCLYTTRSVNGSDSVLLASGFRGDDLVVEQGLQPYRCTSAGADASSIEASVLQNKNNADSYIELYSDTECKTYISTVKHSGFCTNHNLQSVILFVPAISKASETETPENAPSKRSTKEVDDD